MFVFTNADLWGTIRTSEQPIITPTLIKPTDLHQHLKQNIPPLLTRPATDDESLQAAGGSDPKAQGILLVVSKRVGLKQEKPQECVRASDQHGGLSRATDTRTEGGLS